MVSKIFRYSGFLISVTLGLFLFFYLFLKNEYFYTNSLKVNSFVIPIIYAATIFFLNYKTNQSEDYSLRKGFALSFIILTVAGLISHGAIFSFLFFFDSETERLLTGQWFLALKTNAMNDKPENIKQIIAALEKVQNNGMSVINLKNLSIFSFMQFFFYAFVSFFISFLIRTR